MSIYNNTKSHAPPSLLVANSYFVFLKNVVAHDQIESLVNPEESKHAVAELHLVLSEPDREFKYVDIEDILHSSKLRVSYQQSLKCRFASLLDVRRDCNRHACCYT